MSLPLFVLAPFVFGLIIGSFLNALSFRFNTGWSIVSGRSKCMRCGHPLSTLDLIPLVSYLFLRGRCRYCHTRISLQYPLVEFAAGLLSVGVYYTTSTPYAFALWFAVWMLILFICIYDLRHTIIPSSCSFVLMVLALLTIVLSGNMSSEAWLAGPVLAAPLLLISLLSGGTWMGWGDGLFELSLGWMLGLELGCSALMYAIWIGAAVGVLLVASTQVAKRMLWKRFTMKSELPFAPFLGLGAALAYFFHANLFTSLFTLWQ